MLLLQNQKMKVNPTKEGILKRIRQALTQTVPIPFSNLEDTNLFHQPSEDLEIDFAENFTSLQGKFSYCNSLQELSEQLHQLVKSRELHNIFCTDDILKNLLKTNGFEKLDFPNLKSCDAAITGCEFLVARTGSIFLSSSNDSSGRTTSVYAPIHICIAYTNQLVPDIKDGLLQMQIKYKKNLPSFITLATGPSRTADIEKTLVVGIHGPKEVYVFLLEK